MTAQPAHGMLLSLATSDVAPGEVTVSAAGDLDMSACPEFEAEVDRALGRASRYLVLDLSGIGFCGVSGVACLARMRERTLAEGIDFVLVPSRIVRRALEVTGLAGVFPLAVSSDETPAAV